MDNALNSLEPCPSCGALPCDWVDNPHTPKPADSLDPVAWRYEHKCGLVQWFETRFPIAVPDWTETPLYTHPAGAAQ